MAPLETRQLVTFKAVATQLSFTRAAATLGYVQSSVTAQVQALERQLGAPLFERLGRTVTLTDAGGRLLTYTNRILALTEEARWAVASDIDTAATLTIGAPDTLCAYRLPAVLRAFQRDFPAARVVFHPTRSSAQARRVVLDGAVDAALILGEHVDATTLVTELLDPEPLCMLVAPDHPLAGQRSITAQHLHHLPTLLTEQGCGYRDFFDRLLTDAAIARGSTVEFASIEAIKECVKAGMGLTLLPRVAVRRELTDRELIALSWDGSPLTVPTHMLWHKDKWLSPTLSAFLDCVRAELGPTADLVT